MTQVQQMPVGAGSDDAEHSADLLRQYGCGPVQFAGTGDGLYERHLFFDGVLPPRNRGTA